MKAYENWNVRKQKKKREREIISNKQAEDWQYNEDSATGTLLQLARKPAQAKQLLCEENNLFVASMKKIQS